jgi:hypothetical protein
MQAVRASHIHRIRQVASTIFGPGFEQEWFTSDSSERNTRTKFQDLLGATTTIGGKKYMLLPPVLFPDGSPNKDALFLNPVLAKVCCTLVR